MQAEDQAIWWDTLNKMQKLLRKAAASLHAAGKFEKDLMHNYFMSGDFLYSHRSHDENDESLTARVLSHN